MNLKKKLKSEGGKKRKGLVYARNHRHITSTGKIVKAPMELISVSGHRVVISLAISFHCPVNSLLPSQLQPQLRRVLYLVLGPNSSFPSLQLSCLCSCYIVFHSVYYWLCSTKR